MLQGDNLTLTYRNLEILGDADQIMTLRSDRIAETEGRLDHTVQHIPWQEAL